jgi:non-heme chloroperoxidase
MTGAKAPVVFIHGPWLHASSWEPWTALFEAAGYDATAPGWPGVPDTVAEARKHPESQAGLGIAGVAGHYARIAGAARVKPVRSVSPTTALISRTLAPGLQAISASTRP